MEEVILDQFAELLKGCRTEQERIPVHLAPDRLKAAVDFTLGDTGAGMDSLQQIMGQAVRFTPDVQNPTYLSYLYSAPDPVGLLGDWLASLLNTNVHAYEASPFFSLAEVEVVKALVRVVGYGEGSDGVFCPGGSYSNMLALHMARARFFRENRPAEHGDLVCFVSEGAHYSFDRAAALLGLGQSGLVKIKTDSKGRMSAGDLEKKIQQSLDGGRSPFMVCATLGTTVLGAFDPLTDIKKVISGFKDLWLHVDGAWGGAVMMSSRFRFKARGIEDADSVTWDFHKALGAPVLCSVLLQKRRVSFSDTVAADMSYLFHGEGWEQEMFDLGKKTPQCGRRADAFKFWLMWKIRGGEYFSNQVEKRFSLTRELLVLIKANPCFLILDNEPDYWNIAFWYLPEQLRHLTALKDASKKEKALLEYFTVAIHQGMKQEGRVMINYASLPDQPAFLRIVINNSRLEKANLAMVIAHIQTIGEKVSPYFEF